jgi:CHAD domain-containing protein
METDYIRLKEIKPELAGYIRNSQILLKKAAVPDENSIHDIRVLLKKSRAVLKLIGPQIDDGYAEKDIDSLREAAGIMSSWRDTSVHRRTLKELKKEYPGIFSELQENERIMSLMRKPEVIAEPTDEMKQNISDISALLSSSAYRIRFHSLGSLDARELLRQLEQTYLKVVDVFLECRNKPRGKKLHNLRKKSKDFLYQLYFFRPVNSGVVKEIEKELDSMTRNLGKINDLTQLLNAIGYKYPDESNSPALNELAIRIREKQDSYLRKVWPRASEIFLPGRKLVNLLGFKILVI